MSGGNKVMTIKPWREIAEPHLDVREGKFQQAEFAADLSRVHAGTANAEYQNPALFFQRTFITEGMRLLLDSVVKRLAEVDALNETRRLFLLVCLQVAAAQRGCQGQRNHRRHHDRRSNRHRG